MINKELNPALFVNSVKTSGDTSNLAVGQFMLVDTHSSTENGLKYASDLNKPRNKKTLRIDVGATKKVDARSMVHRNKTTPIFALEDIDRLDIVYPVNATQEVDEWVIGYNGGVDEETSLKFQAEDKAFFVVMELDGGAVPYSAGGAQKERFVFVQDLHELTPYNSCNETDPCAILPCKPIVKELIERMRERQYSGGRKLKDIVDITPILSCGDENGVVVYKEYTLTVCDAGDEAAKATVQSQTNHNVERISRTGSTSTYRIIATGTAPADVVIPGMSYLAECGTCPVDADTLEGGYVYTYTLYTNNANPSVVTIPGQVSGTNKLNGVSNGIATFSVRTSAVLTSAQIATLVSSNPTIVVDLVGEAKTVCSLTETTASWVVGEEFESSTKNFSIDLPDTKCGENRLEELRAAYPEYEVGISSVSVINKYSIDLGGTSGTGVLTIKEEDYTVTFDTDLSTTAGNLVTDIEEDVQALGGSVSNTGSKVFINIPANISAPTYVGNGVTGTVTLDGDEVLGKGCRNTYEIKVPTNFRAEECDDVFKDFYIADKPRPFMEQEWKEEDLVKDGADCLCGIRIKAKSFNIDPSKCIEDKIDFLETSTKIKLTAGFAKTMSGYMDMSLAGNDYKEVHVEQTSFRKDRDMLGGNLKNLEIESNIHFLGRKTETKPIRRALLGMESILDNQTQYVKYSLVLNSAKQTQSFSNRNITEFVSYDFYAPLGTNLALENELKRLVAKAGAPIGNPSI